LFVSDTLLAFVRSRWLADRVPQILEIMRRVLYLGMAAWLSGAALSAQATTVL
jgi:hypothetical protein